MRSPFCDTSPAGGDAAVEVRAPSDYSMRFPPCLEPVPVKRRLRALQGKAAEHVPGI